ncbi:hypothetical protein [Leptolyngbya sp. FACHB-261]|uniref:hypothetical protein n=1 Tax=Leptolyngbya sp. FACHB-261 TaxID=2692806 RepID=UPI001686FE8F|nr:hypothetical protein [Leptolyngbya sp. FACHB-261]MBD2101060.1 hypothetical protein [Leptolyngbya sp. FACHB-261]
MNTELSQAQSVELSDAELEGVAGGVALGNATGDAFAFGQFVAATDVNNETFAISADGVNAAGSKGNSTSIGA